MGTFKLQQEEPFVCDIWHFFFFSRHQGFGVLSVILANHAIKLLTSLFQDLQVEALHRVNNTAFQQLTVLKLKLQITTYQSVCVYP